MPPHNSHCGALVLLATAAAASAALPELSRARAAGDGGAEEAGARPLVEEAEAQLEALEFERARETIVRAIHAGRSGPDQIAEIYRLAGEIAGSYGDVEGARGEFERHLALEPEASLETGVSPRIAEPFEAAKTRMQTEEPLRVEAIAAGGDRDIAIVVDSDPLGMVEGARVDFRDRSGASRTLSEEGESPYTFELPRSARGEVRLAAVDRHGNRLEELSWDVEGAADVARSPAEGVDGREASETSSPPLYARWYVWGGAATGLAAGAAYFGLSARSDQRRLEGIIEESGEYEFEEAERIESRARRNARLANIAAAAATAGGVAAAVFFFADPGGTEGGGEAGPRAFVTPLRGGGAAAGVELGF